MLNKFAIVFMCIALAAGIAVAQEKKDEKASIWDNLVIGGEMRLRFEAWNNFTGSFPAADGFSQTLSRTRFNLLARPGDNLTAFIQFQDSRVWGEEPNTLSAIDNVDLHQAWFEYSAIGDSAFALKVGRMELNYGDQRLIGGVGWSNIGRAFDAVMLTWKDAGVRIDGFFATTTETYSLGQDAVFGGIYATFAKTVAGDLDLYALVKKDDRMIYSSEILPGKADLMINTFGARLVGALADTPLTYGAEAAIQTGDSGGDDHEAWALHARLGWKLGTDWKLALSGEFNYATGDDDPADGTDETFDNLFPTNHNKYGYLDFIGWKNIENWRAGISAMPVEGHSLTADWHLFRAASTRDAIYTAGGGVLLNIPAGIDSDDIGQEIDLTWSFSPARGLGFLAGWSHFFAGDLFELALPTVETDDADFFYLQTTLTF